MMGKTQTPEGAPEETIKLLENAAQMKQQANVDENKEKKSPRKSAMKIINEYLSSKNTSEEVKKLAETAKGINDELTKQYTEGSELKKAKAAWEEAKNKLDDALMNLGKAQTTVEETTKTFKKQNKTFKKAYKVRAKKKKEFASAYDKFLKAKQKAEKIKFK